MNLYYARLYNDYANPYNWMIKDSLWIEKDWHYHGGRYILSRYTVGLSVLEELGMAKYGPRYERLAVVDDYGNLRLVDLAWGESQWEYREELEARWKLEGMYDDR